MPEGYQTDHINSFQFFFVLLSNILWFLYYEINEQFSVSLQAHVNQLDSVYSKRELVKLKLT